MRRARTNPGKVIVYTEVAAFVRREWRWYAGAWTISVALLLAVAVLPLDPWVQGLYTGLLVMAVLGFTLWLTWWVSDLLPRLEGVWAEEWTGLDLDKDPQVLGRLANLRFAGYDVDQVAVTRSGVLAVECKMRRRLWTDTLDRDAHDAATRARTLGHQLRGLPVAAGLGSTPLGPVLVYWGRAGRDIAPLFYPTAKGPVVVLGGRYLTEWLAGRRPGPVGPDYARELTEELEHLAHDRDQAQRPESRMLRRLSRVR